MKIDGSSPPIAVIIATLNEQEGIGPTLMELKMVLEDCQYLVVDGNSMDRTVEMAKEMGADVLIQHGSGKGDAIAQAIKYVRTQQDVKYVLFIDADFTYPVKCVPGMVRILKENPEVGMVTGNRFNSHFKLDKMNSPYYLGNRLLAWAQLMINGVKLRDPLTGLRVIRWGILKNWVPLSKGFDIEAEINHRVERQGYKTVEIPIRYRDRLGEKKLKLRHGFIILRRIISESMRMHRT